MPLRSVAGIARGHRDRLADLLRPPRQEGRLGTGVAPLGAGRMILRSQAYELDRMRYIGQEQGASISWALDALFLRE